MPALSVGRLLRTFRGRLPARGVGSCPIVLLASEGRRFGPSALECAAGLALADGAEVRILSVARIWGTSLGFPNPWLMPSRHEWQQQRDQVAAAVHELSTRGLKASGEVVGTRNAARRIAQTAERLGCSAIIMGAEPPRAFLIGNLLWSQEPQRVKRRTRVPVHLVVEATGSGFDLRRRADAHACLEQD